MDLLTASITETVDWVFTRSEGKLVLIVALGLPILAIAYLVFPKSNRNKPSKTDSSL